jgi:hypothetical protein
MDADRDGEHRPRHRQRDGALAGGHVLAAGEDAHDARGAGPRQDFVDVIEARVGEVRVRVDVFRMTAKEILQGVPTEATI